MEKVSEQKYVDIQPIIFQTDDTINDHLDNTGKILVALKPKPPLNSVVYPIPEAKSSTTFNFLTPLKQNR